MGGANPMGQRGVVDTVAKVVFFPPVELATLCADTVKY